MLYLACDGMKLVQGVICLPLAWPYAAVIMALWLVLLSEKPSGTSRVVRQQIKKTVFKLFNFYSYILFGVGQPRPQGAFSWLSKVGCVWRGGRGAKNYQEIRRGAELILLLRTGGALRDNFAFEAHFSAPS